MKINGVNMPNNPMQAYLLGQRHGNQQALGSVAMVLFDKFGWHGKERTEDERDQQSIAYLYDCIIDLTKEINSGRIKHKDIKEVLAEEYKVAFED